MHSLQKAGGVAALLEAAIYVGVFAMYGAVLSPAPDASPAQKLAFLSEHREAVAVTNLVGYVIFGGVLAVLVAALHERLKTRAPALSQIAAIFGLVWVGLVIASGMIANVSLDSVLRLAASEPEHARAVWLSTSAVVEGLGGGNEIVGGVWVLLLSIAALKGDALPRALGYFGAAVGVVGILTVHPADVLTEMFGVSQIVWFAWLGVALLRAARAPLIQPVAA